LLRPDDSSFSRFSLGGVPIPRELEPVHFLFCGTTGSGKTVAIKTVLDAMERDNQRVISVDSGADLCTRYYSQSRGDIILNPLDARCAPWSPLAEIRNIADCMQMSRSICPTGEGSDKTWTIAAQNFLASIFQKLLEQPNAKNRDFLHWVAVASLEHLREFLAGTPAAPYCAEGNEKMFGSVRATAMERTAALFLLDPESGRDGFSVRKFIAEDGKSWLFTTYQDDQLEMLRFFISTIIDIAAVATLSLTQNPERRVVFSLDEFDSIGKVGSVLSLLTKGRKYGASALIGIQTISQLRNNYGHDSAQTIAGNCGSWLVLLTPDPETAKYVSEKLGTGDYIRKTHSIGHGKGGMSTNRSEQIERGIPAVAPGEIFSLPRASSATRTPPQGFLSVSGQMPCKVTLSFPPARSERDVDEALSKFGYVPRPDLDRAAAVAAAVQRAAREQIGDLAAGDAPDLEAELGAIWGGSDSGESTEGVEE
jgi:type IV secretory pathway TraG/TraD family ATPase VirD4